MRATASRRLTITTGNERGSMTLEASVAIIGLFALLSLVLYAGRASDAQSLVIAAAQEGARAASLVGLDAASGSATLAAQSHLADAGLACGGFSVVTELGSFAPGGQVTVTVSCTASFSDLGLLNAGDETFSWSATEVIDTYRAVN
jgi:hypothetical protein